jgi:hypothetical protein
VKVSFKEKKKRVDNHYSTTQNEIRVYFSFQRSIASTTIMIVMMMTLLPLDLTLESFDNCSFCLFFEDDFDKVCLFCFSMTNCILRFRSILSHELFSSQLQSKILKLPEKYGTQLLSRFRYEWSHTWSRLNDSCKVSYSKSIIETVFGRMHEGEWNAARRHCQI